MRVSFPQNGKIFSRYLNMGTRIKKILRIIVSDRRKLYIFIIRKLGFLFCDSLFLKLLFKLKVGYSLDLKNPKTYNEKLQWLKLYNHRLEYKKMVDKYDVKKYVSNLIGDEYVIPTYGLWASVKDIEWDRLPNQFVIKTTHGGGGCGVVICRDKSNFDVNAAVSILNKYYNQDIYKSLREWPYKGIKRRIIAEKFLEEPGLLSLKDYKLMCFNGKVRLIEYHEGRYSEHHTQDFYDCDWHLTKITQGSYGEYNSIPSPKPALLDEMIRLSEVLAEDIPHVRVDWYIVDNHLYFGELTFFDGSGLGPWDRYEDDLLMGSWITLPEKSTEY